MTHYTHPSNYREGYLFEIWRKHGEQPARDANKAFGTPDAAFALPLKEATVESWIRYWDRECRGWRTGL